MAPHQSSHPDKSYVVRFGIARKLHAAGELHEADKACAVLIENIVCPQPIKIMAYHMRVECAKRYPKSGQRSRFSLITSAIAVTRMRATILSKPWS